MAGRKSNRRNTLTLGKHLPIGESCREILIHTSLQRGDHVAMMDYRRFNGFHKTVENGYLDAGGEPDTSLKRGVNRINN
jgi:hypothetical protein